VPKVVHPIHGGARTGNVNSSSIPCEGSRSNSGRVATSPAAVVSRTSTSGNTASAEQLTTLPGVGPKLAARIVEYRQKSGAFKSVHELMNVKDICSLK
jgi:competence protein ComEA